MKSKLAELERICLEALTLPPAERSAYLAFACKDDSVRREVESLLSAEGDARNLFPTQSPPDLDGAPEDYGTAGAYEIQEKLGEGGMGIVFRARQSAPVVRDVALKVVRPGMASRQLVARFLMERQALAIMDHPNIARVLDAGETSRGLPYFVMELDDAPEDYGTAGAYEIQEKLGEGGMGIVFRARQSAPVVRDVALCARDRDPRRLCHGHSSRPRCAVQVHRTCGVGCIRSAQSIRPCGQRAGGHIHGGAPVAESRCRRCVAAAGKRDRSGRSRIPAAATDGNRHC